MNNSYDVAIIGAGISGSALFYALTHYTDIKKVALLEKYSQPATLSSSGNNNSQTIHSGDIETNYTFEKAKKVSRAAGACTCNGPNGTVCRLSSSETRM